MRRRRQKNTLLPKMLGIAVVIVALLLPILSQLGVFKVMRQHLEPVTLVKLPPEKKLAEKKKTPPKKRVAKARPKPSGRKAAPKQADRQASRPNPNQPKVVAASGTGNSDGGPTIDNSGTGTPGQIIAPPPVTPAPPTEKLPEPPPPVVSAPPVTPAANPPPVPPHEPVLTEALPLSQPRPTLPDDLSVADAPPPFRALFTVHSDGTADVKMLSSTGNAMLDDLAMRAARRWTFRPATSDGKPIESFLRLRVNFDLNG